MKTTFGKTYDKVCEYRQKTKVKQLRDIKLVGEVVKCIVRNDSKILTNKDIKEIALKTYKRYNEIIHARIRSMTNSPEMREKVNDKLLDYYIKKGIKPLEKVFDLTVKAEEAAKSTSDFMSLAKHFREIADLEGKTNVEQTETINYNELMQPVSTKITRKISKTVNIEPCDSVDNDMNASPNAPNEADLGKDLSNNDKQGTNEG